MFYKKSSDFKHQSWAVAILESWDSGRVNITNCPVALTHCLLKFIDDCTQ